MRLPVRLGRRIFRILLNVATVLALLLCAATVALWVRSGRTADVATRRGGYWSAGGVTHCADDVVSLNGKIALDRKRAQWPAATGGVTPTMPWQWRSDPLLARDTDLGEWIGLGGPGAWSWSWKGLGGGVQQLRTGGSGYPRLTYAQVVVPYWLVAAAAAALPVGRFAQRAGRTVRRRRRSRLHLCAACGYDLRATPDRCPECGQAPARL